MGTRIDIFVQSHLRNGTMQAITVYFPRPPCYYPQQLHSTFDFTAPQALQYGEQLAISSFRIQPPVRSLNGIIVATTLPAAAEWLCASHAPPAPTHVCFSHLAPQRLFVMTYSCYSDTALLLRSVRPMNGAVPACVGRGMHAS